VIRTAAIRIDAAWGRTTEVEINLDQEQPCTMTLRGFKLEAQTGARFCLGRGGPSPGSCISLQTTASHAATHSQMTSTCQEKWLSTRLLINEACLLPFCLVSSSSPPFPLPSSCSPTRVFYPAVCLIVEGEKLTTAVLADPASSASTANHQDHRRNGEVCSLPAAGAPASRSRSASASAHRRRSSSHDHGPRIINRSDSHQSPRARPYQLN
jgi:hypothetical protein